MVFKFRCNRMKKKPMSDMTGVLVSCERKNVLNRSCVN